MALAFRPVIGAGLTGGGGAGALTWNAATSNEPSSCFTTETGTVLPSGKARESERVVSAILCFLLGRGEEKGRPWLGRPRDVTTLQAYLQYGRASVRRYPIARPVVSRLSLAGAIRHESERVRVALGTGRAGISVGGGRGRVGRTEPRNNLLCESYPPRGKGVPLIQWRRRHIPTREGHEFDRFLNGIDAIRRYRLRHLPYIGRRLLMQPDNVTRVTRQRSEHLWCHPHARVGLVLPHRCTASCSARARRASAAECPRSSCHLRKPTHCAISIVSFAMSFSFHTSSQVKRSCSSRGSFSHSERAASHASISE